MAISAAIGDKATFDKLWTFTRHFLSKSAKKYCGGLMGWIWKGPDSCRPLDTPCDPDTEECPGDGDSAFDGDVDIGIGLVYAAMQWPEYRQAAVSWILKMECEMNAVYESPWIFASAGDTWNKNCQFYETGNPNSKPCTYTPGSDGTVYVDYYPPGYFRVFGDFLNKYLSSTAYTAEQKAAHRAFWYKGAESVYEQYERCYDQAGVNPGLVNDKGTWSAPCSAGDSNYDWARYMWRVGIDAAWFGNRTDVPENVAASSKHYPTKSRMQAKIDNIQEFFNNFSANNPVEQYANRFSSICGELHPDGAVTNCDPGGGHNSYFVGSMACAYVSVFDDSGKTTGNIRREAVEEAISTAIMNDKYFQESLGVYSLLFLTGNFPNPLTVNK
jgi:endo-1,4-beta-D-glucanase Y